MAVTEWICPVCRFTSRQAVGRCPRCGSAMNNPFLQPCDRCRFEESCGVSPMAVSSRVPKKHSKI